MKLRIYIVLCCIITIIACRKNGNFGPQTTSNQDSVDVIIDTLERVAYIINEGNFGGGNASVSVYNTSDFTIQNQIFKNANNTQLGDVAQSMFINGRKGYLIVNNSQKIEVLNMTNFKKLLTINGFNSPRYLLPVSENKAYVTDLYQNAIYIVNLNSNMIEGEIPTDGWTEKMLKIDNEVYVAEKGENDLLVLDILSDAITDSLDLTKGISDIVIDNNGKLWVLCTGGIEDENAALYMINPTNLSIEKEFIFGDISHSPNNLVIDSSQQKLYFINTHVYEMSINDNELPTGKLIDGEGKTYYALEIDTKTNELYVSDAKDYVQNGTIYRYSSSGVLIDEFQAGIIPGGFVFN